MSNPYRTDIVSTLEWLGYSVDSSSSLEMPNGKVNVTATIKTSGNLDIRDVLDEVRDAFMGAKIGGHQNDREIVILAYF